MIGYQELQSRIHVVRRIYRLQVLMKGLALVLAAMTLLAVITVWGAGRFGFQPTIVWVMRAIMGIGLLPTILFGIYLLMRRDLSDVKVAQFIEERYPALEDRLVTAMEYGPAKETSSGLPSLLVDDACGKVQTLDFSAFVNRRRVFTHSALSIGAILLLLGLLRWGPPSFSYGIGRLYLPWVDAESAASWQIRVAPGDVELARGSDVEIRAQLVGFDAPEVKLSLQQPGETAAIPVAMEPAPHRSGFFYLLADVQSSARYHVEAKGARSRTYSITVTDLPRVSRIDLDYHFPGYTGMAAQAIENQGAISAIKGTRVVLAVRVDRPVQSARLRFDDDSSIELASSGGQTFGGSFTVRNSGAYVIELGRGLGRNHIGSSRYEIEALDDLSPRIAFTRPLRDVSATSVEEVFAELRAEDDIGVGRVELRYTVNGGPERSVSLYKGAPGQSRVIAPHTFFLEAFGLQPGDLVSYYGKAADNNDITGPGVSASDIYFIQIRPLDRRYTQSQQGITPGHGRAGAEQALSNQQKEIITSTFRLIRDRDLMDAAEYNDSLKMLALIQGRLRDQASGLLERLRRRGTVEIDPTYGKMGEYLEAAIGAMEKAAVHLGALKPEEALPEEQKALQQVMRAESLFREVQISFSQGSGDGSAQTGSEDLAAVLELELNKLRNQYETVERGERQARDSALDEALARLRELARRQIEVNEQQRLRRPSGSSSGSSAGTQSQQQVIDQAEALRRQLQRLMRERSLPDLGRAAKQIERAIQEMKKALDHSRHGEGQEATNVGSRALQQLNDARNALAQGQDPSLNAGIDQAMDESKRLLEAQDEIQADLDRLSQTRQQAATQEFQRRRHDVSTAKSALADRVKNLGNKIDELSRRAGESQRETSARLNEAVGTIREKKLPERILGSSQLLNSGNWDLLKGREAAVRRSLEDLNKQLESARKSIGETREGRLEDAANRARELADSLESLRQRMLNSSGRDDSGERQGGRDGQPSRDRPGGQNPPTQQGKESQTAGSGAGRGGSDPGGRTNAPANARGLSANTFGPPGSGGIHRDEDIRQLQRELGQRLSDANQLRSLMNQDPTRVRNLNLIIDTLQQISIRISSPGAEQANRLRGAIDQLHELESDIDRELAWLNRREGYHYADESGVPSDYRRLVEEYYRALAKGKP